MKRTAANLVLAFALLVPAASPPALACVGKTVVVGAVQTPEGRVIAQILAILINERTGTTVKIADYADPETLHRGLAAGEADIGVEFTGAGLARLGLAAAADGDAAYQAVKAGYLERLNLVWLPRLGFTGASASPGDAAPVARKDTLKKFPALPRLIAKTEGLLSDEVVRGLTGAGEPARAAREFLREKKLI